LEQRRPKLIALLPCAVLVAGDAPESAALNAYEDIATAERHRKEWLATTARRPDSPAAWNGSAFYKRGHRPEVQRGEQE
jgi:hypothetical protein